MKIHPSSVCFTQLLPVKLNLSVPHLILRAIPIKNPVFSMLHAIKLHSIDHKIEDYMLNPVMLRKLFTLVVLPKPLE